MNTILIQPPQAWPFNPYLVLPALAAHLRRDGHRVVTVDANLDLFCRVFSRPGLEQVWDSANQRFRELDRRPRLDWYGQEEYLALVSGIVTRLPHWFDRVDSIPDAFRDPASYDVRSDGSLPLETAWRDYQAIRDLVLPDYPTRLRLPALSLHRLRRAARGREPLPYDHVLADVARHIAQHRPGVVGFSFTFSEQMLPGLVLAHHVRQEAPDAHIVLGGSCISALRDAWSELLPELPFVDSVILDEGEIALAALVSAVKGSGNLKLVPSLLWRNNGGVVKNDHAPPMPLAELAAPDFEDVQFCRYFASEPVLPYASARGCYWGRCAFCNFTLSHRKFRVRPAEMVADDLALMRERYGRLVLFVQECEPADRMRELANEFTGRKLDIDYWLLVRFEQDIDRGLLRLLRRSGCRYLFFGLEAGSRRVNELMRKGIDHDVARRILSDCADEGINVILSSIRGFPGETRAEWEQTEAFYREVRSLHSDRIRLTGGSHLFRLNRGSDVDRRPERYGVVPGYREGAGELATVFRSFRVGSDDGHRLAALRQEVADQSLDILYNDVLVLIATARVPDPITDLVTARPHTVPSAEPAVPDGPVRLRPDVRITACRYPIAELKRRGRDWTARARTEFIVSGRTLERVTASLASKTADLEPSHSLVVSGPGGSLAVPAGLAPLLDRLRVGEVPGRLAKQGGDPRLAEAARSLCRELLRRDLMVPVPEEDLT